MTHGERALRRRCIADAVNGGSSLAEACEWYGVCVATVKVACAEHGVDWPRTYGPNGELGRWGLALLADLLNSDDRVEDIAARRGVSVSAVYERRKAALEAGIKVPRRRRKRA